MSDTRTAENESALRENRPRRRIAWRTPALAVLLLVVGAVVLTSFYDVHRMQSQTMEPTISVRDAGVYAPVEDDDVRFGDVVRVTPAWANGQVLVFRVIGLPGDTLSRDDAGTFTRNGGQLDEPYLAEEATQPSPPLSVEVPAGRVFLAGDSRAISNDSAANVGDSDNGTVAMSDVSGRLVGVGWPVWHWSMTDSERGVPLPFIIASIAIALGSVLLLFWIGRKAMSVVDSISSRRAPR